MGACETQMAARSLIMCPEHACATTVAELRLSSLCIQLQTVPILFRTVCAQAACLWCRDTGDIRYLPLKDGCQTMHCTLKHKSCVDTKVPEGSQSQQLEDARYVWGVTYEMAQIGYSL